MIFTLISIFLGCVGVIYLYFNWKFSYWNRKNFPFITPNFPFGNVKDIVLVRKTIGEVYQDLYWKLEGKPLGGFFSFFSPMLLIRDEELIKTILVKDFNSFHDNDFFVSEKLDPLMAYNAFALRGNRWKQVRHLHIGSATSAKLRGMMPLTVEVCKNLITFIEKRLSVPLEGKELCAEYATDNIASCAFGLKCDSLLNANAEFNKITKRIFVNDKITGLILMMTFFLPQLLNVFRLIRKDVSDYFIQIIKETIEYRENQGVQRDDFLQQMIKASKENSKDCDYVVITSQCFGMLSDGFVTTSISMSFLLYELAMHPEIQENVRNEIETVSKNLNDFDYDKLHSLTYLDMVVQENLRLHPPAQTMTKRCTKDTTLTHNGVSYKIEKGTSVAIPIYAIHKDKKYFPNPEEFIPERFSEEQKSSRDRYVYLPFGEGPRICLGMKFALTQIKLGLVAILLNFIVKPKDRKPIEIDPCGQFFHTAKGGLWLIFNKRNT